MQPFHRRASVGLPRLYRATESSKHSLENAASAELRAIFYSETVRAFIEPANRTSIFQNETFSLLSCIRCVMTDALFEVHGSFPIAAFQWLSHPEGIDAAIRDEPCHRAFDLFTKTWVRYWSTEGRTLKSAPVIGIQSNQGITISVCCFLPLPQTRKSKS